MKNIILIMLFCFTLVKLNASEYNVDKSQKREVLFTSKMTLEDFTGQTDKVDGFLADSKDGLLNSNFYFEADMNSMTTGLGLRDRHMRDNYLHTSKFPKSNFKGTLTSVQNKNNKFEAIAEGDFFVHGVGKKVKLNVTLTPNGTSYKVISKFIIKLPDYKIEIPQMMFAKINENIEVEVEFVLKKVK